MSGSLIRFKRGNKADLPKSATSGTPLWCEDTKELFVGTGNGVSKIGVTSNIIDNTSNLNLLGVTSNDSSVIKTNNLISISGSTINANNFNGLATKATSDSDGNIIKDTYAKKSELEGLSNYHPSILTPQWSDHLLEDISWLRGDNFTWHDGVAYSSIYDELYNEFTNPNSISKRILKTTPIDLPTFTSNTTSNITVSDSRENANLYTLMNGVTSMTLGLWSTYWFEINYNEETFLESYFIRADNNGSPEYPKDWVLVASNDGDDWIQIDEQVGQVFSLNQTKTYTVNCETKFKKYRLIFSNGIESSSNAELGRIGFKAHRILLDVNYLITPKGYKIFSAEYENYLINKFETDGIAWFYLIDTVNKRFKLPRTKYSFRCIRTNVGDDIEESIPNITGGNFFYENGYNEFFGAVYNSHTGTGSKGGMDNDNSVGRFDASRCSSAYKDGAPVQERATQMYLYFYSGQYSQSAIEQAAGINSELLNNKVDISNLVYIIPVIDFFIDGTSGYIVFSNGYCKQWGTIPFGATGGWTTGNVTFLKNFKDTNYSLVGRGNWSDAGSCDFRVNSMSVSGFSVTLAINTLTSHNGQWEASGMLEEGEY